MKFNFYIFELYLITLNSIGLFFSFIILFLFKLIYWNAPSLVNRTTLRLQAAMCLIDFLSHIRFYIGSNYSDGTCSFLGFIGFYLTSVYLTITTCITLCFHLNLLSTKKVNPKTERYLWYSVIILPALHVVPPYALGNFGPDVNGFCYLRANVASYQFMLYYVAIIPQALVYIYCLIVILFVIMRFKGVNEVVAKITDYRKIEDDNMNLLQKIFQNWLSRLIMYPLAYIFIISGVMVDYLLKSFNIESELVLYWAVGGLCLKGFFHFIALMLDPDFIDALLEILSFKFSKFVQNWKKEYRDELARAEAAIVQKEVNEFGSDFDNRAWEEYEAKALLQKCTRNF